MMPHKQRKKVGQCHQCPCGRRQRQEGCVRPLPQLQADEGASGEPGRQLPDCHACRTVTSRLQFRGDSQHSQIREPCQEHQGAALDPYPPPQRRTTISTTTNTSPLQRHKPSPPLPFPSSATQSRGKHQKANTLKNDNVSQFGSVEDNTSVRLSEPQIECAKKKRCYSHPPSKYDRSVEQH